MNMTGHLRKMIVALDNPVHYQLPLDEERLDMNALIGRNIRLIHNGEIHCIACGRKTNKSFNQGYCYPCFTRLPECDRCIVKPEKCHYAQGTCRDPEWGEQHCLQDHVVYLANSSGIKVGITRAEQVPTRWIDQGAGQALAIFRVNNRLLSGKLEVILKQHVSDKTDWRKMLRGAPEAVDLPARRDELFSLCAREIGELDAEYGAGAITPLHDESPVDIEFPVTAYPNKVSSLSFDKTPEVAGRLQGIKGQYLILDHGVINMRKFAGYKVQLRVDEK